jgi:hypothetical protein
VDQIDERPRMQHDLDRVAIALLRFGVRVENQPETVEVLRSGYVDLDI